MNQAETVWAFDLGKASIGEAVRQGTQFLHKASLLIPSDFAETKTAANRRRMWRTREAHKKREEWLEKVWKAAGLTPLAQRHWQRKERQFIPEDTDYRLKREFAPTHFQCDRKTGKKKTAVYKGGKAKDGAPAATPDDFKLCYTSSLLRIKLLRGNPDLKEWQIYKALHAAIQKRGYERVPWAAKEAARLGMTPEEQEKKEREELEKKEPKYRETITAWDTFLRDVVDKHKLERGDYGYPCYYDACRMGLWKPESPKELGSAPYDHNATSVRNIRFHRKDLEAEFLQLVANADKLLDGKLEQARLTLLAEFKAKRIERIENINQRRRAKNRTLPPEKQKRERLFRSLNT